MLLIKLLVFGLSALSAYGDPIPNNKGYRPIKRDLQTTTHVLESLETQMDKMTAQILRYREDPRAYELFERENNETIGMIAEGGKKIAKSAAMTVYELSGGTLLPHMGLLSDKTDKLIAALNEMKPFLERAGLKSRVIRQLKLSQTVSDDLNKAVIGNLPRSPFSAAIASMFGTFLSSKFAAAIKTWESGSDKPFEPAPAPIPIPMPMPMPIPTTAPAPAPAPTQPAMLQLPSVWPFSQGPISLGYPSQPTSPTEVLTVITIVITVTPTGTGYIPTLATRAL